MKERQIKRILKPNNILIIITIIALIVTLVLILVALYIRYKETKEISNLGTLIENYEDIKGKYAKINIKHIPNKITESEKQKHYYFVTDEEGYIYIANITNKTYKKLEKKYNNGDKTYELKGYLFNIPSKVKKAAIETGNKLFEEEKFTYSNLSDYVGNVYLDETKKANNSTIKILYAIATVVGIFACALFISSMIQIIKLRKFNKNKELVKKVKKELEDLIDDSYKKQKLYLTNNYIISKTKGLEVFEYKDIIWEYSKIKYINGIAQGKYLNLCTRDKKVHSIARTGANYDTIDEIMKEIKEKNPNIKIGFTKDNREYFKKIKKESINDKNKIKR